MPAPLQPPPHRARLYLVSPRRVAPESFARDLGDALSAADVACLLISLESTDEALWRETLRAILPVAQGKDVAVLLDGHVDLAHDEGADGTHIGDPRQLRGALAALKPGLIVGAGGIASRHDAMIAGEAGADYVAFGEPQAKADAEDPALLMERVSWWAELFETPCVAFAGSLDAVGSLSRAGADFVAVGEPVWSAPEGTAEALRRAGLELRETV